jgi:hypothetical protein
MSRGDGSHATYIFEAVDQQLLTQTNLRHVEHHRRGEWGVQSQRSHLSFMTYSPTLLVCGRHLPRFCNWRPCMTLTRASINRFEKEMLRCSLASLIRRDGTPSI